MDMGAFFWLVACFSCFVFGVCVGVLISIWTR